MSQAGGCRHACCYCARSEGLRLISDLVGNNRAAGLQLGDGEAGWSVVAAMNRLAFELDPKDSFVLYYAGHGELVESTKPGCWQLADSDAKRPQTWLSNAGIGRMVAQFEASQVTLISDSRYSGSRVTDQRIRGGRWHRGSGAIAFAKVGGGDVYGRQ